MRALWSATAATKSAKLDTVTVGPPAPPVVMPPTVEKPTWAKLPPEVEVVLDEEDELEELLDELEELELLELLLEELEAELLLDEELELEELELLEAELLELEELELDELDELELDELELAPTGIEHSFTPPATRVPAPKVASLQIKLPLKILKVNRSARPKATLVLAATVHVLFSVQIVT
jgi:hypothetical protein